MIEGLRDADGEARRPGLPRGVWIATALGAVWRLGYLFVAKWGDPLLLNDALYYSIQAGRNSEGDWFREVLTDQPGAEHGPLTSLYLTPWSLGGWGPDQQRLGITLLGIATVPVIGLVATRLAGRRAGVVAAAIAAAYPNLWINDSLVMSETVACLLVAVALAVALAFDRRPRLATAAALGAVVGLATLARSELLLLALAFAVLAWLRSAERPHRRWMPWAVVLGAIAVVGPWAVYNLIRFERPVLLTTNDGTTLLGANCDRTYYDEIGGWDIRCLGAVRVADAVDPSVRAEAWRDAAVDYAADHWQRAPLVVAARLGRVVDVYAVGNSVQLDAGEEKARIVVWAGVVAWWLLAVAAVVGWTRAPNPPRWWLAAPIGSVLVTAVLFYGAHRIRAPMEPAVVVLAAVAVGGWIDRLLRGDGTLPS
jgi:4-amino-4-deoxy-L-arabinose transferase-like glycosyltransferase